MIPVLEFMSFINLIYLWTLQGLQNTWNCAFIVLRSNCSWNRGVHQFVGQASSYTLSDFGSYCKSKLELNLKKVEFE